LFTTLYSYRISLSRNVRGLAFVPIRSCCNRYFTPDFIRTNKINLLSFVLDCALKYTITLVFKIPAKNLNVSRRLVKNFRVNVI